MLRPIPPRFIGYGAYGLCFDKYLGALTPTADNFFVYLRKNQYPINLVKVICFREPTIEVSAERALPFYNNDAQRTISQDFLANLDTLVTQAEQHQFWVQVCLFSFHNVEQKDYPKNSPPEIIPTGANLCERLRSFFTTRSAGMRARQTEVVTAIATKLKNHTNILWELANEVRMSSPGACKPYDSHNQDDLGLVGGLNDTKKILTDITGTNIHVGTSTGIFNEALTARNVPSTYFDFHSGQWGSDTPDFARDIHGCKDNCHTYNPNAFLIINDDGAQTSRDTNRQHWAEAAFINKLHYSTKAHYPPDPNGWDTNALDALKKANNHFPA
jgi:hypothetical protein